MQGLNLGESNLVLTHKLEDDFHVDLDGYTDSGTLAFQDQPGGEITLTTGTTANNEAFRHQVKKTFKPVAGKPLKFATRVKFTDAATTTGALAIGISNQAGAALIANGGAAVKTGDQTSLMFVKLTGESLWRCYTKIGSEVQSDLLSSSNLNNALREAVGPTGSYQELEIEVIPQASDAIVAYSIDKQVVCRHRVSLADAAVAAAVLFVKTTTTDAQVLTADYLFAAQKR